jgi:prevent-host-death family protein
MIVVNIHEAKAKLSEYLDKVARGEQVVICKRNRPIAELRAIEEKRTEPRSLGLGKGTFSIPPSFFEPMPDDWLDEFYNGPVFPDEKKPSRVAEGRAVHRPPAPRRRRR